MVLRVYLQYLPTYLEAETRGQEPTYLLIESDDPVRTDPLVGKEPESRVWEPIAAFYKKNTSRVKFSTGMTPSDSARRAASIKHIKKICHGEASPWLTFNLINC